MHIQYWHHNNITEKNRHYRFLKNKNYSMKQPPPLSSSKISAVVWRLRHERMPPPLPVPNFSKQELQHEAASIFELLKDVGGSVRAWTLLETLSPQNKKHSTKQLPSLNSSISWWWFLLLLLLCSQLYLWGSPFWVRFLRMQPFF